MNTHIIRDSREQGKLPCDWFVEMNIALRIRVPKTMLAKLIAAGSVCALGFVATLTAAEESRDTKVINDRSDVLSGGRWIYNDLAKGFTEAKRTGKPLLVVLRCIP